jgi:hypothetical protein
VAAVQALVPRDPHQERGRACSESRSARGCEAIEAPTGGDSTPRRGRSRRSSGPAPEPAYEVLVVWSDGYVMSQRPAHNTEASTSCIMPLAPDATVSQLEQGRCHPGVLHALFDEAQADQALWQKFRTQGAVVWTSLGPLPRWVPRPTTRWAPGTTRLALHGT